MISHGQSCGVHGYICDQCRLEFALERGRRGTVTSSAVSRDHDTKTAVIRDVIADGILRRAGVGDDKRDELREILERIEPADLTVDQIEELIRILSANRREE